MNDNNQVRHLKLQHNKISNIPEGSFTTMKNLQNLYLNDNKLQKLTKNSFTGMPSLKFLWLQMNGVSEIEVRLVDMLNIPDRLHRYKIKLWLLLFVENGPIKAFR